MAKSKSTSVKTPKNKEVLTELADKEIRAAGDSEAIEVPVTETPDSAPDEDQPDSADNQSVSAETKVDEPTDSRPTDLSADENPSQDTLIADEPIAGPITGPKRRGVFVPIVLGGLIAGAIGYGAALYGVPKLGTDVQTQATADLQALIANQSTQLSSLDQQLTALTGEVGEARQAAADTTSLDRLSADMKAQLATLFVEIAAVNEAIAGLAVRLTVVEKRPLAESSASSAAAAAYEQELLAMQALLEAQKADVQAIGEAATARLAEAEAQAAGLEQSARATANAALSRAAMVRIDAALSLGGGFDVPLAELSAATGAQAPAVLIENAAMGVATLVELQKQFPDAARAALAAALPTTAGSGIGEKLTVFLRTQVGARSLQAREGDDPDAVLSRTEAAVVAGDLAAALGELATLPGEGQAAMALWLDQAKIRIDTLNAARALAQSLNN